MLQLPKILNFPPKMLPLITRFNDFLFFLFHGGRSGGKSHSVGRFILYLGSKKKLRIICGREQQKSIDDSVYALLVDIINKYNLNYQICKDRLIERTTGTVVKFRGFFEQGKVNIKGLEGVDILWIDEAQAITQATLDYIIPTIRKQKARIIFTMNRLLKNDAVYKDFAKDPNCFCQKINYYDNPYNNADTYAKAEKCKQENPKKYSSVWLGNPEDDSDEFIFNANALDLCKQIKTRNVIAYPLRFMAVDLAGQGGDVCTLSLIDQLDETIYKEVKKIAWGDKNTLVTEGKIIHYYAEFKPDLLTVDADGLGYPIFCTLQQSIPDVIAFHGNGNSNQPHLLNARADGYHLFADYINNLRLGVTDENTLRQMEYIKREFSKTRKGLIKIQSKSDMKKEQGESPDYADSTMMNIHTIEYSSRLAIAKKCPQLTITPTKELTDEYGW